MPQRLQASLHPLTRPAVLSGTIEQAPRLNQLRPQNSNSVLPVVLLNCVRPLLDAGPGQIRLWDLPALETAFVLIGGAFQGWHSHCWGVWQLIGAGRAIRRCATRFPARVQSILHRRYAMGKLGEALQHPDEVVPLVSCAGRCSCPCARGLHCPSPCAAARPQVRRACSRNVPREPTQTAGVHVPRRPARQGAAQEPQPGLLL